MQTAHFAKLFAEYGVSEADFINQLSSFKVDSNVGRAKQLVTSSGLTGTPAIMVNSQYLVVNSSVKSPSEIMDIANFLLKKLEQSSGQ